MTSPNSPQHPGSRSPAATIFDLLTLSLAFSMIAAVGQLLRVAYIREVRHAFAWTSRDALWMTPLALMILFSVMLLLQRALGAVIRPLGTTRWLAFTAVALCVFSLSLNLSFISPLALLMLALGVASVTAPALTRASHSRIRTLFRVGMALAVTFAILGIAERATRAMRAAGSTAHAPMTGEKPPNVLLLIWDTVRAENLSLYGYVRPTTPSLSRVASEGIVFARAISPSSWTLPSHGAFFTGHRAGSLGVDWRVPYDGRFPTLAQAFQSSGYATSAFTANLWYTTWESGLNRGFDHFDDYLVSAKQVMWSANLVQTNMAQRLARARSLTAVLKALGTHRIGIAQEPRFDPVDGEVVIDKFLKWQATHRDRPFFAFVNLFDAHTPMVPPPRYRTKFAKAPTDLDLYDASIAYLDDQLGILVDSLRARGELDRTILVIASDHGEQFGEHGLRYHGNSLYSQLTHVPLVIRYPSKIAGGTRDSEPVSLTNLPATIAELAGLKNSVFPGRSLAPGEWDRTEGSEAALTEVGQIDSKLKEKAPNSRGRLQSVVVDHWQYVLGSSGREELFDLATDPAQVSDLSGIEQWQPELVRLRALLKRLVSDSSSGRPTVWRAPDVSNAPRR